MRRANTLVACRAAFALAALSSSLAYAAEYKNMTAIENDVKVTARGSGGDAQALRLRDRAGNLIRTVSVDAPNPANDIKRRNIWFLKIAKRGGSSDRVKILVTGTQHAREWVAYRTVLDAAQYILANKGRNGWPAADPRFNHFRLFKEMNIKDLTDNAEIFAVPVVNPEGYQYSKANDPPAPRDGGGWRKNRRDVRTDAKHPSEPPPPLPRFVFTGVDLNRSYPSSDWGNVTYFVRVTTPVIAPAGRGGSVSEPIPGPGAKHETWTAELGGPAPNRWRLTGTTSGFQGNTTHVPGGGVSIRSSNGDIRFTVTDGTPAFAVGDKITFTVRPSTGRWDQTTSRWRWNSVYCGRPNGNSWLPPIRPPVAEKETEGIVALSNVATNRFNCQIDVHSYGGTVGWVQSADGRNANLRPTAGFPDYETFQILAAQAAALIKDPAGANYVPEASPYPTSGDTLVWQYENTGKKCFTYLIEIGDRSRWQFRPANSTAHAKAVLPGQLFMMFATVDDSFSSKPTASFSKP